MFKLDMTKFPYKEGDVLSNGIVVVQIIKGDGNDSFKAYKYKRILPNNQTEDIESTKQLPNSQTIYLDGQPTGIRLIQMCVIGDPDAAYVYYSDPSQIKGQGCKPDEFLVKYPYEQFMGTDKLKQPDGVFCTATTANGEQCKRKAVDGLYCPQHAAKVNG